MEAFLILVQEIIVKKKGADVLIHYPVMLSEVLEILDSKDGEIYVDGTFGAGGYTKAILDVANCNVIAIDRDFEAKKIAGSLFILFFICDFSETKIST